MSKGQRGGKNDGREKVKEEARQHPLIQPMFDSGATDDEKAQWALDSAWKMDDFQIQLLALVNTFPTVTKQLRDRRGMPSLQERGRELIRANYHPLDQDLDHATAFHGLLLVCLSITRVLGDRCVF